MFEVGDPILRYVFPALELWVCIEKGALKDARARLVPFADCTRPDVDTEVSGITAFDVAFWIICCKEFEREQMLRE